jgi:hypothetical protein
VTLAAAAIQHYMVVIVALIRIARATSYVVPTRVSMVMTAMMTANATPGVLAVRVHIMIVDRMDYVAMDVRAASTSR